MKYYAVVFDRKDTLLFSKTKLDYEGFHNDFIKPQEIYKWWHFLDSMYIIATEWSSQELSEHFTQSARSYALSMTHIVLEVNLASRYGRLNKDAWEWIDNEARTLINQKK